MKPDVELTCEMEDDIEAVELFSELGMLVTEGRTPVESVKGRVEGPHCPRGPGEKRPHECQPSAALCVRAQALHHQMVMLWKNKIPMCIEVLLYPECDHGQRAATSADVTPPAARTGCVLLEQWNIQVIPRRACDGGAASRALYQAVRSYLHFSQLSAWYNLSHGASPGNVGYRISPPGEFCTSSFPGVPMWHTFPTCPLSKSTAIQVTVGALPRSSDIIKVPCYHQDHIQAAAATEPEADHGAGITRSRSPPSRSSTPTNRSSGSSTPTFGKGSTETLSENSSSDNDSEPCLSPRNKPAKPGKAKLTAISEDEGAASLLPPNSPHSVSPVEKGDCPGSERTPVNAGNIYYGGAKPKRPTSVPYQKRGQYSPQDGEALNLDALYQKSRSYKPLQSPKVLFSKKSAPPGFFAKERLNNTDSSDSDNSSPDMDRFLKSLAVTKEGLSPSEIETYLAHLASRKKKRAASPLARKLQQSFEDLSLDDKPPADASKPADRDEAADGKVHFFIGQEGEAENGQSSSQNGYKVYVSESTNCSIPPLSPSEQQQTMTLVEQTQLQANGAQVQVMKSPPSPNAKKYHPRPASMALPSRAYASADQLCQNHENGNEKPKPPTRPMIIHSPTDAVSVPGFSGFNRGTALFKSLVRRELINQAREAEEKPSGAAQPLDVPTAAQTEEFQQNLRNSANMIFHAKTGLPLQSSPAPVKKKTSSCGSFHFDESLTNPRAIKNSISCVSLDHQGNEVEENQNHGKMYSISAPASTNRLLGNFEESVLNGRIEPSGVIEGFTAEIGASGAFCPKHITLPVTAFFFTLSDDNAPSPYLGHINLESLGKRGYHIPKRGTVQVTLFNPNHTVVKMFVVMYDLSDMPSNCQTFLRQRTLYMPTKGTPSDLEGLPVYLRYLIHLRFASSKTGKIYLHTDLRLIFARDKFEFDSRVANYELRSFTDTPCNPKYSPRR